MESFESKIPKEQLEDRPEIFSRKSFPAVIRLARRFHRLLVPTTPEETQLYQEKYGEQSAAISSQELESIESLSDLRSLVEERTAVVVRKELGEVLRSAKTEKEYRPTKGSKLLWKENDFNALLNAAADKRFDEIDESRNALVTTALGVSLIAEHARTDTMARALNALPETKLESFGMNTRQQEVIILLLGAITKINTEYMRFQLHIRREEPLEEQPKDTLRERKFIAQRFSEIIQAVEHTRDDDRRPIFESDEKDEAFVAYLNSLKEAYRAFEEDSTTPLTIQEQQMRKEKVQEAFLSLHTRFPDFPLIVFPAFSHYGGDEAAEGSSQSWKNFGFDPEIRLYWQTKEQREKQRLYHQFRDRFADKIQELYPSLVNTNAVSQYRVLIGEPIAASGINIKETTTSQEEQNIVLMTESKPDASDREAKQIFETYLEDENDFLIVRSPAFRQLMNNRVALHEFGHGLYPEQGTAADALGEFDDQLAELKSDLAMWVTAGRVLKEYSENNFGEKALRAIQLSMVSDAISMYRGIGRVDSAYTLAAQKILERLNEENVFVERNGKLVIDTGRLDQDFGPAFEDGLREILNIYHLASKEKEIDLNIALREAKNLIEKKPQKFLKKIRRQK